MHTPTANTKRHHSQISTPPSSSKKSSSENGPFDSLMHVFGSFQHLPLRQARQQQQRRQAQTSQHARLLRLASARDQAAMQQSRHAKPSGGALVAGATTVAAKPRQPVVQRQQQRRQQDDPAAAAAAWRTAVDPRSQKPYYWNVITRESRWKKPLELATEEEREAIRTKERKQRDFFDSMERNILRKLEGGRGSAAEVAKEAGNVSPASSGGLAGVIDQSWMQGGAATASTVAGTCDDWISGWITPGSSDGGNRTGSPVGSLSSIEGLSVVMTPGSTGSLGTNCSIGREERDDKLHPLQRPSKIDRIKSSSKEPVIDKPNLIRTISKMEYELVHQLNPSLRPSNANKKSNRMEATPPGERLKRMDGSEDEPLTPTNQTCDILSSLRLTLGSDGLDVFFSTSESGAADAAVPVTPTSLMTPGESEDLQRSLSSPNSTSTEPAREVTRPNLAKRNTCGTIYLGSTLSAPDKDALIKCVCGVYRAHLLQNEPNSGGFVSNASVDDEAYEIFHDRLAPGDYRHLDTSSVPSLSEVTDFYRTIFLRSQMEVDCIIISLIYVERLIKMTAGRLAPQPGNWRSVLFVCMVLASKVWDDLSMWNCDFSKIGPSGVTFSLPRTNELEVALLCALEYRVKVGASEYAKYYFLLRGMLCRSGLACDDLTRLQPLDTRGVQTLRARKGGREGGADQVLTKERSKSYGDLGGEGSSDARTGPFPDFTHSSPSGRGVVATPPQGSPVSKRVSLEQIVRM